MSKDARTTGDKNNKRKIDFSGKDEDAENRENPAKRITRSASATPVKESSAVDVATRREQIKEGKRPVVESGPQQQSTKIRIRVPKLPPRLLDRSEIPKVGKINSYSKTEHLLAITEVLHGTSEYETLRDSDLGKVFELTTKRGALSGKVTHNLLCRMLLTRKRRELWFVFANRPIRYSLKEFGYLTGMNCGPYPPNDPLKDKDFIELSNSDNVYWHELIGPNQSGIIKDIVNLLQRDKRLPEEDRMPMSRRFRLALVVLIDGVLCCKNSAVVKASRVTVEMVKNIDSFLAYPWGQSFELTLEMVTPGNYQNPTIKDLVHRLTGQANVAIKGFTAAFQLLLYETCSSIKEILEEDETVSDFTNQNMVDLPKSRNFSNSIIAKIDNNPKTTIISILDYGFKLVGGDYSWPDEVEDPTVVNMLNKIKEGHKFKAEDWVKGIIELPPIEGDQKQKKSKNTKKGTIDEEEAEDIDTQSEDDTSMDQPKVVSAKRKLRPRGRPQQRTRGKVAQTDEDIEEVNPTVEKVWLKMLPKIEKLFKESILQVISGNNQERQDGAGTSMPKPQQKEKRSQFSESQNIVCALPAEVPKKQSQVKKNKEPVSPQSVKGVLKSLQEKGMLDDKALEDSDEHSDSFKLVRRKGVDKKVEPPTEKDSFDLDDVLTEKLEDSHMGSDNIVPGLDHYIPQDSHDISKADDVLNVDQFDDEVQLPDEDFAQPVLKDKIDMEVENQPASPVKKSTNPVIEKESTASPVGPSKMSIPQENDDSEDDTDKNVIEPESSKVHVQETDHQSEDKTDNESEENPREEPIDKNDVFQQIDAYQETTVTVCEGSSKEVGDGADSDTLGVRRPSNRHRKKTVKFGQEELQLGLGPVDKALVKKFINQLDGYIPEVYMIKNVEIPITFFAEIYTKSNHVNTTHMDLILESVWSRCAEEFLKNRSLLTDIFFIEHLLTDRVKYPFKADSATTFEWHKTICNAIEGSWTKRPGKTKWYDDVDKVYTPMHWEPDHWVGLCIDLVEGRITIFDSQIYYVKRTKMMKTMQPLMEILPQLVKHIAAKRPDADIEVPSKFTCERPTNVSQNSRSGDCGPLSIKYMELHALGKPLDGITEKMVDNLRMRYAIDVYQKFVQRLT